MGFIKLLLIILTIALFLTACSKSSSDEVSHTNLYPNAAPQEGVIFDAKNYYARENLDLQAVGALLEKADNAEKLEYLLNSDKRISNLDLNQDGFADYISVSEFEDGNEGERGISLFSRFGPDLIQEIATIIFDRDNLNAQGARILLSGDEQLYGDNYYYEANWLDRALPIVRSLFNDRDSNYSSPYYYNNYPDYYQAYEIVDTPVYSTRIEQIYDEPLFIQTSNPTINEIEIRSPYEGRTLIGKNYPKPAKPAKEKAEVRENNPGPPELVPVKKGHEKDFYPEIDKKPKEKSDDFEKPRKADNEKSGKREKPNNIEKENEKPPKAERQKNNPSKPDKDERSGMKPPKQEKAERVKGGEDKPGKGNDDKNKGGGKGKGKKN